MSDLQQELLAIFRDEAGEHLAEIRRAVRSARDGDPTDFQEPFRRAHSLKGAARAVGNGPIEAFSHDLEALLSQAEAGAAVSFDEMDRLLDAIEGAVSPAAEGDARHPDPDRDAPEPSSAQSSEYLRVAASQVEQALHSMETLSLELHRGDGIEEHLLRIQAGLRGLEQKTRRSRWATGAGGVQQELSQMVREVSAALRIQRMAAWSLDRAADRLRDDVGALSLVPIETVFAGFGRMVRELAQETDRRVEFRTDGFALQADRRVLQALRDPVMHLLRNAVSHGVEAPDARARAGKTPGATIHVRAETREGILELTIRDDGRGLDFNAIEARARAAGLLRDGGDALPLEQLSRMLFAPGFSTADAVDRLSGRGMGLSIVQEAARRLQGAVDIRPAPSGGTEVMIAVPLIAARHNVLLVEAGVNLFALPVHPIEKLLRLGVDEIQSMGGSAVASVMVDGIEAVVPIVGLGGLLGMGDGGIPVDEGMVNAVLMRWGGYRCAVAVDRLLDAREEVVTDAAALTSEPALITGSILVDERPVLVLSPSELLERWARSGRHPGAYDAGLLDRSAAAQPARPTILVVDDSITTRTLEKSILEAQGYRVVISVDGLDALNILRTEAGIDLVVSDIEMPRMDGFSLLQAMKNDTHLTAIPVILMTSRADPEDVQRGLDLGADAYITKQRFDQRELLAAIAQLL